MTPSCARQDCRCAGSARQVQCTHVRKLFELLFLPTRRNRLFHGLFRQGPEPLCCPSREEVGVERVILCHFSCAFLFHVHLFSGRAAAWEQNLIFPDLKPNTWLSKGGSWFPGSFGKCWQTLSILHMLHAKSFVSPERSVELFVCGKLTWLRFPPRSR